VSLLRSVADHRDQRSLAHRLRLRRFGRFLELVARVPAPWAMLDVGGTPDFWRRMRFVPPPGCRIVLLNRRRPDLDPDPGLEAVLGDATDMSMFGDRCFDVVFSNSAIEHVGDRAAQERMAAEVRRVGRRYVVQTPSYWFPLEPHFLLPGIQWLPAAARAEVVFRLRPGWYGAGVRSRGEAREAVDSIRLLRRWELARLFPEARIGVERLVGLPKSYVAYGGW